MKPTKCSLIPTNGTNTIHWDQIGRASLVSSQVVRQDAHIPITAVLAVAARPLTLIRAAASLTSLRRFLGVLRRAGLARGTRVTTCDGGQATILNSRLR